MSASPSLDVLEARIPLQPGTTRARVTRLRVPALLTLALLAVADHLGEELGVAVEYVPVTDYAASVSLFRAGDLDMGRPAGPWW